MSDAKIKLIAAIDFGTTFSGYAFAFTKIGDDTDEIPKILMNKNWGEELGFQSHKTATSVLLDDNDDLVTFGFAAEQMYFSDVEENKKMLLFRHFKMKLLNQEDLKLTTEIMAIDGTKRPAILVISHAIRFLKNHFFETIEKQSEYCDVDACTEVQWVITVPAIWGAKAKEFMRAAAYKAGCIPTQDSSDLLIALEPEAASLCCRRIEILESKGQIASFPPCSKYLVLDCGGGTVDITAHELDADGRIKEIFPASGGAWGGTTVDENFIDFLGDILGKSLVEDYIKEHPMAWLHFITTFERCKKSFKGKNSKLNVPIEFTLAEYFRSQTGGNIKDILVKQKHLGVKFASGNFCIGPEVAQHFFQPSIDKIIAHLKHLLKDPKMSDVKYLLMVGGFSECVVLQEAVKAEFENENLRVLIPHEAQLAIIKGAVMYALHPREIKERVIRTTFGLALLYPFDPEIHDAERSFVDSDGLKKIDNVFYPMLYKGNHASVDESLRFPFTVWDNQQDISFNIFALDEYNDGRIHYTDEPGMVKIGSLQFGPLAEGKQRLIELNITFGQAEFQFSVNDKLSGDYSYNRKDFLS